jgi:NitT/TauT family transport system substrate-binding protein
VSAHDLNPSRFRFCILCGVLGQLFPMIAMTQLAGAAELPVIRVATTPNDEVTALLYAVQTGLFSQAGLDVRVERQSNGGAVAAALIGGSYQIGKVSVTALFNAHAKGLPLTIVAPAAMYDGRSPFTQLIVAKDSPISNASDLNDKTIGVDSLNGIGRVACDTWMMRYGGAPKSVHYVEMPFSIAEDAVESHRVDAYSTLVEPYLSKAIAAGKVRAYNVVAAISPTFLYTAWVANADWAATNPAIVRTFAKVLTSAAQYTNAHPSATIGMIATFTGLPEATVAHMIRATSGTSLKDADLQPTIDAAVQDGLIPHAFPASSLIYTGSVPK